MLYWASRLSNRDGAIISSKVFSFYRNVKYKFTSSFNASIPDMPFCDRCMLGTSGLNPPSTTSSWLFASRIRPEAPREQIGASFRADLAPLSRFCSFSLLLKRARTRELPRENWLAKLVNFASTAGRNGKRRRWRLRGNLRTRALENSRCTRTRSFTGRSCYCFWNVLFLALSNWVGPRYRGPKRYCTIVSRISAECSSQRSQSNTGKLRPFFPRSTYRSILILLYANLHLFLSIFVICISIGNN